MEIVSVVLIVVSALLIVGLLWVVGTYNGFVRLRNLVEESWRQIDVELHRRHDLIPNLVETVQGYAAHERDVLAEVTAARTGTASPSAGPAQQAEHENQPSTALGRLLAQVTAARAAAVSPAAGRAQQAEHENQLTSALGRLMAVAEAYPQLRASESFVHLQSELTNTEDRIAAGRRFYNANVRALNTKVESFPSNAVAHAVGVSRAEYFEIEDPSVRAVPRVDF